MKRAPLLRAEKEYRLSFLNLVFCIKKLQREGKRRIKGEESVFLYDRTATNPHTLHSLSRVS